MPNVRRRMLVAVLSLGAASTVTLPARAADDYPSKPITLYVPFAAGGGTDLSVRMVEPVVAKLLGQKVLVVNRQGTATINSVVTGTADGYTLVVGSTGNLASLPHNPGTPYTRSDYIPVAQLTAVPALLAVPAASPYNNLGDLISDAKKKGSGGVKVGISPLASISHLAMIQIEKAYGVKFTYIPHKSNGDVMTAVLGGHVDVGSVDVAAAGPRIIEKAVKGIAVYSAARMPELPDVPTVREQGTDLVFGFFNIILAPKGTPPAVVQKLDAAFRDALKDPEVVARSKSLNIPIAYLGPAEARAAIDRSYDTFGQLLTELGLKK